MTHRMVFVCTFLVMSEVSERLMYFGVFVTFSLRKKRIISYRIRKICSSERKERRMQCKVKGRSK